MRALAVFIQIISVCALRERGDDDVAVSTSSFEVEKCKYAAAKKASVVRDDGPVMMTIAGKECKTWNAMAERWKRANVNGAVVMEATGGTTLKVKMKVLASDFNSDGGKQLSAAFGGTDYPVMEAPVGGKQLFIALGGTDYPVTGLFLFDEYVTVWTSAVDGSDMADGLVYAKLDERKWFLDMKL